MDAQGLQAHTIFLLWQHGSCSRLRRLNLRIMSMCQLNVLEPMNCLPHEKKKRSLLPRITKTFVDINRTDEVPTARKRHPKNDRLIKSTGSRQFLGSTWEIQALTGMRFRESLHVHLLYVYHSPPSSENSSFISSYRAYSNVHPPC